MKKRQFQALLGLALAAVLPEARAGSFTANFNDGNTPAGSMLYGNTGDNASGIIETTGGAGDTGCLKLTKAVGGKSGSMIIEDLDAGNAVNGFTANFKVRIGGGTATPADGMAFCFGPDLPDGTFGETGAGSGLKVGFDIYNNGGEAPAFVVYWNNVQIATTGVIPIANMVTGNDFVDVMIRLNNTGTLDMTYKGNAIFTNLATGFQPISGGRFGFGARTGGATANQFVDDLSITTSLGTDLQPSFSRPPLSARIIAGYPAPMNVRHNNLVSATYQWERKAPAAAVFTAIPGAQSIDYVSPPLALTDAGTQFRMVLTNSAGVAVTSPAATFDVVTLPHATPDTVAYNFNDGLVPNGTNVYGSAGVQPTGGVSDSGYLSLTTDAGNLAGTFLVDDLNAGGPVAGIDLAFKLLMTPAAGAVPADGFGFHWAPDLPEAGFPGAEEPVGNGLSVGFDVYNNGNNEAPAVDVFWLKQRLGGSAIPAEFLNTQGQFADVQVRLAPTGLVDVAFNGVVIVYQLQIPNWTAFSGARYGFAARTGGASQAHYVEDVRIKSTAYVGTIGFVSQPAPVTTIPDYTATFNVTTNDPLHTNYQWQSSTGGGPWTNIGSATAATYTTPALTAADNGKQIRVHVTSTVNGSTADSAPVTLTVVNLIRPANGQIRDLFDNNTPNNTGTVPAAVQTITTGTDQPGAPARDVYALGPFMQLNEAVNAQFGTMVIDDFNANQAVGGFDAAVKVQIVGANPADGWSFSWGTGIAQTYNYDAHENGFGSDLRISFITYSGNAPGRRIRAIWRNVEVGSVLVPIELMQTAADAWEDVRIRVVPANGANPASLDVAQDGVVVIKGAVLTGLTGLPGARFAIGARTGGLNESHSYDDLTINTSLYVGPISLLSQPPATQYGIVGRTVTLKVESSNPPQTTYRWQRAAPGSATFTDIPSATSAIYVTPPFTAADNGAAYQCVCTSPANTLTSTPSVITVVDAAIPSTWELSIPFTDGVIPDISTTYGTATATMAGGVGGTGTMNLTAAANDQNGAFVLPDLDDGNPVDGFTSQFLLQVGSQAAGNATASPADGIGFVWTREPITGAFGEGGTGTGLIISFDIYDNDDANPNNEAGEAPAVEAFWNGVSLGNFRVPLSLLQSGVDYYPVLVRVNPGGTLDVIVRDTVVFWNKPLPGYAPVTGGNFGWGGRTGGANAEQSVDSIQLNTNGSAPNKPSISYTISGGNVILTFDGVLETSTNLQTWAPQPTQTSPLTIPISSLTGKLFLRARK